MPEPLSLRLFIWKLQGTNTAAKKTEEAEEGREEGKKEEEEGGKEREERERQVKGRM